MCPSNYDLDVYAPPSSSGSSSTDEDRIFGWMPPDDTASRDGTTRSRLARAQSSRMTDLAQGPFSFSSHSRTLATPPTATSTSFPITPRSNGPQTPFTPSWNLDLEHRSDTIQGRIASVPSTGGSGGMMFSFRPPTQDSIRSPPTTASQLSSITEFAIQGSFRCDDGAKSEELMPSAPSTASSSRLSKELVSSSNPFPTTISSTPSHHASIALQVANVDDEEDSPYAEVRASVSNIDDPDMPCLTWRMWAIGLVLCVLSSGAQMFFYLRYPAPSFDFPITMFVNLSALERLPIRSWKVGSFAFDLNPGPFNVKEHTAAFILCSVSAGITWSQDFIIVAEKKYHLNTSLG
ncbi:hypothetical protein FRC01_011863 [Tulasnella sp. 417]|nr:hypothetical protein FRC01_011863 [Tulasnella sp. 417]